MIYEILPLRALKQNLPTPHQHDSHYSATPVLDAIAPRLLMWDVLV